MIPFSDTVSVYASASNFFVDLLASHFGFKIGSKIPPDFSLYFWIFHRRFTISWLKLSFLPQGVTLTRMTKPNGPKKPCVFFANPEPPHRLISHMYFVSILFYKNRFFWKFWNNFWNFFKNFENFWKFSFSSFVFGATNFGFRSPIWRCFVGSVLRASHMKNSVCCHFVRYLRISMIRLFDDSAFFIWDALKTDPTGMEIETR